MRMMTKEIGNKKKQNDDYGIFLIIIVVVINGVNFNNPLEQGACALTQELCRLARQIVLINTYQHNLDINSFTKLLELYTMS